MDAARYPIDIDRVEKGLYITPDEVEGIVGIARTEAAYSLEVMRTIGEITRLLGDRAIGLVIRQHGCGIKVLTDSEAATYLAHRQSRNVMDIGRTHVRQQLVDVAQLTSDERQSHERKLSRSAAYVQALSSTGYRRLPPSQGELGGDEC